MKILWVIIAIWTAVENGPLTKPFENECKRVGGFIQIQLLSKNSSALRCIKFIEKDENKEPERIPNSYRAG